MSPNPLLEGMNPRQKEAVKNTEGPLLLMAGAGSGKTRVLTHRIAYLIEEKEVNPWNILAITFTNKAAKEMKERVNKIIPAGGEDVWVSTFHSMCVRILRREVDYIGYSRNFTIIDGSEQLTLMKRVLKELNIDPKKYDPRSILAAISNAKNALLTPSDYEAQQGAFFEEIVARCYDMYQQELKVNECMDFDDLIMNTIRLFKEHPESLHYYQNKFHYIHVDEYQDTNHAQYTLVNMLAERFRNLCVVGDADQSIYGWRGADMQNILDFEKDYPDAKVILLEQNYRSTSNILDAAHSVIAHNRGRKPKKLWTEHEAGNKITYFRAENERDEAYFVAAEINRIKTIDRKYSDFAILYRTNAQSRTFEEALSNRGIPYRVLGGLRYYDRKEIKDMLCYMRLVQNHADDLALTRIINEPKRGIGGKTLEKLTALASVRQESLFETLLDEEVVSSFSAKASANIEKLAELIAMLSIEQSNMRISDLYDELLVKTGYLKDLEEQNTLEAESRIENLMEFKSVIYDYEKNDPNITLPEFMERIALLADVDNHDADENAVVLMTMHSAKGLEFPFVFLPGLEDGLFPGWRAFDREDGLEEERRLCYVGITRAKERLWLTSAEMRTMYGKTDYTRESQFLREMDKKLLEGDAVFEKKRKDPAEGAFSDGISREKPFQPFDQLKYARQQTKQKVEALSGSFLPGDRVSHPKFGEGTVQAADARTVTVAFADGTKKLAIGFAPIKKI